MGTARKLLLLLDLRSKFWIGSLAVARLTVQLFDILLLVSIATFISLVAGLGNPGSQLESVSYSVLKFLLDGSGYLEVSVILGVAILLRLAATITLMWATARLIGGLEAQFARKLIKNSMADSQENTEEDFSSRRQNTILLSTTAVAKGYSALIAIFSDVVFLTALLATAAFINWRLALAFGAFGGIIGITLFVGITGRVKRASRRAIRASGDFLQEFKDFSRLKLEIRLFQKQKYWLDRVAKPRKATARNVQTALFLNQLPRLVLETVLYLGLLVVASLTSSQVFGQNAIDASTLTIFLLFGLRFVGALTPIISYLNQFAEVKGKGGEAIKSLLANRQKSRAAQDDPIVRSAQEYGPVGLRIQNLAFGHETDKPTLADVNLEIKPGELVAITGKSGRGKSTLLHLIAGSLEPDAGDLIYFTTDGNEVRLEECSIGYVPQFPHVFRGSIGDNIVLGDYKDDFADSANTAADAAGLELGSEGLSLDSSVDSEVSMVSGGQAQRVGLARALYVSPNLLLLDEPTSALDKTTTRQVMDGVFALRGKVTVIAVTHDQSLLEHFDQHIDL